MKTKSNMTDNREIKCKFCKGTGKIYSSKMTTPSGLIDCPDCKTQSNMTVKEGTILIDNKLRTFKVMAVSGDLFLTPAKNGRVVWYSLTQALNNGWKILEQ